MQNGDNYAKVKRITTQASSIRGENVGKIIRHRISVKLSGHTAFIHEIWSKLLITPSVATEFGANLCRIIL